jgi:hypothetical protein
MEKQFVYIARIINHKNRFVEDYYKIGKTGQRDYKIRESQLSPTNFPMDVIFIRLFQTNNMVSTEAILQTCFDDYKVVKIYDDRKKQLTEWYDVPDDELLENRINKLVKYMDNVVEVDLINNIKDDVETTKEEKQELIKTFRKSKSRLQLTYEGEDISMDTSTDTYLLCLKKIAEQTSWELVMDNEIRVTKTLQELEDRNPSADSSQLKPFEGYVVFTGNNNDVKYRVLSKLIKKLNIKNLHVGIKN